MSNPQFEDSIEGIAIIGISCRFPGAKNVEEFWGNLKNGVESITFFSDEELISAGVKQELIQDPNFVKAKPVLEDIDLFDADFFGFTPREAEIMDPQHRFFLECAWEVLENAGYDLEKTNYRVGVYGGTSRSSYLYNNIYENRSLIQSAGLLPVLLGNDKDYLTTRVSYKLNLSGPSISVNTACSTSLVTVCLACQSLLNFQSDIALAGGVTIIVPQNTGYYYQDGSLFSPDGHCRAFDAEAKGTVFGSGIGLVALKRLKDALADNDYIYSVIKGFAINNDGYTKIGYTAPSVDGQAEVIAEALALSGIKADTIDYVEAHGTGTSLGDPIEIAALTKAYRAHTNAKGCCAIGSVKSNVGHLNTAAGVAGLIKTALSLKHRKIPPSLHFENPNPEIDFSNSPFYVNTKLSKWKKGSTPRRAGVSSFGVGGTNAHVILEEAPLIEPSRRTQSNYLLITSANTESALNKATINLAKHLKQNDNLRLSDVAYTLQVGRKSFTHRRMVICRNTEDAIASLEKSTLKQVYSVIKKDIDQNVVFMFPGQGAQYVNMGLGLYKNVPIFHNYINQCAEIIKSDSGIDICNLLFPGDHQFDQAKVNLNQTYIAQSVLFVVEYALARMFIELGVRPRAMIGHSIGEYAAACLAGVLSLEDALSLISKRGRLMQTVPVGAMLAVDLHENDLRLQLNENLSLAAINSPNHCVVSGSCNAIKDFEKKLSEQDVSYHRIHTSHAFHSDMMDTILKDFAEEVRKVELNPPQIPYISNLTGKWIKDNEPINPGYWARHLRQTVRFSEGIHELLKEKNLMLVEIGPGNTLITLAKQHRVMTAQTKFLNTLSHPKDKRSDEEFLLNTLGSIWCSGVPINWSNFYANEGCRRVPLPTYQFERKRFWIGSKLKDFEKPPGKRESIIKRDIDEWFYRCTWKRSPIDSNLEPEYSLNQKLNWLVFLDECGLGTRIVQQLKNKKQNIITVKTGEHFNKSHNGNYFINPRSHVDWTALFNDLKESGDFPQKIIHLWAVTFNYPRTPNLDYLAKIHDLCINSLVYIAQTIGRHRIDNSIQIDIITNNMQQVTDDEDPQPEKATILGPVKVIPKEYPETRCRSIDIIIPENGTSYEKEFDNLLFKELLTDASDPVVAYRDNCRWVPKFEPVKLPGDQSAKTPLRKGGTYLITGGLGGIGFLIAEYLAQTFQANLILIGRSNLPVKNEWENWLSTQDEDDDISRRIRKVKKLEVLGSQVQVTSVDVANYGQMVKAIDQANKLFDKIDGVIHCAGILDGALIHRRTREITERVLAPKITGTLVLDNIFKNRHLDFFILFSSLSSILGPIGQVGYSAACAFLDSFAKSRNKRDGSFTVSIDWDVWKDIGMASESPKLYYSLFNNDKFQISKVSLPLLETRISEDSRHSVYVSRFSASKDWFLNEHRILGKATLPGTAYLEIAREAFLEYTNKEIIEIREVYFLSPMIFEGDEEKVVHTVLIDRSDHFEFSIASQNRLQKDVWQEHAKGIIVHKELTTTGIKKINFDVKLFETQQTLTKEKENISPGLLPEFGNRWKTIKSYKIRESDGFAIFELPEAYIDDLESYKLHPALLDSATGFLVIRFAEGNSYLPFFYKKLSIRKPLPRKIFSYARLLNANHPGKETLSFNITIMDENGQLLVEVEEYTLRKVDLKKSLVRKLENKTKHENVCLVIKTPGILKSLEFCPSRRREASSSDVEIEVSVTGINFKDVLIALGILPKLDDLPLGFGMECAGKIIKIGENVNGFEIGDEVIAFAPSSFSSFVTTPASLVARKPFGLSLEEAATIPLAFTTAYYALMELARLIEGESVLIHAAAGGVGLAAVQIAQWRGAQIFATAGNRQKREFLRALGIKHVSDSRSLAFADDVMKKTDGRGVDVVLNSLSGEFIQKSLSVLAPFGRFVEIGIRDIMLNNKLSLKPFAKGLSFFSLIVQPDLPYLVNTWRKVVQSFEAGIFHPLAYSVFKISEVVQAFEYMTSGKHIGKIVVLHQNNKVPIFNYDSKNNFTNGEKGEHLQFRKSPAFYHSTVEKKLENETTLKKPDDLYRLFDVSLSPKEGIEAFTRILKGDDSQILVSTHDFQNRQKRSKLFTKKRLQEAFDNISVSISSHPRPELSTEYVAPRNEIERKIAEIWEKLLGIDRVGIYDNFFELGGHSLLAAQIYAHLQKELEVEIPLETLFEKDNVAALSKMIDAIQK